MHTHIKVMKPRRYHKAFSMVEMLVAVVVLAVGLLGIAALHVTTLRSGGSAISRMQAVNLASDLADRIRANQSAKIDYAGAGANNDCFANPCSPSDMAASDLNIWNKQITDTLPGPASGAVTYDDTTTPATYTIVVAWKEQGGLDMSYTLVVQI